jgi:hypothetical protein
MICSLRRSGFVLFAAAFLAMSGCSGCRPVHVVKSTGRDKEKKDDHLTQARGLYRNATEAVTFRQANDQVNDYFAAHPDALAKYQPKDLAAQKEFLQKVVGLDTDEIAEVQHDRFKLLDARYLESCFLLRDAARAWDLPEKMSPLDRANFCFRWVVRQVALHETRDELLPPQFVLRRGSGNSGERAFVFLALLKQFNLDGCILALPGDGPIRPWLVGVLIEGKEQSDIYLFDPRLGLPVPGPDGKGIATLGQFKDPAKLLSGFKVADDALKYDVEHGQVAAAEIRLLMPLSALSARMQFLEKEVLHDYDRITLAVRPQELIKKFEALKEGPVAVWNTPPGKGVASALSPTRALRQFLPPDEGVDASKPKRLDAFNDQLVPVFSILRGLDRLKLSTSELPGDATSRLVDKASRLWTSFALSPQQQLVRGRLDDCSKRLVFMQMLLDEVDNEDWEHKVAEWRERVLAVYKAGHQGKIHELWHEDQWLDELLEKPDEAIAEQKKADGQPRPQRKVLGYIVLRALYEPLHSKTFYLLALRAQQLAELAAAAGGQAQAGGEWNLTAQCWLKYCRRDLAGSDSLKDLREGATKFAKNKSPALAVGLLNDEVAHIRQAAAGRLLYAQVQAQRQKPEEAVEVLKKLIKDLDALAKNSDFAALRDLVGLTADQRAQVEKVYADLFDPRGSLFWMRYTAALLLAELEQPAKK